MSPLDQYLQMVALKKRLAKAKSLPAKDVAPDEKAPTTQESSNPRKRTGK
jgi:hypothetical protein